MAPIRPDFQNSNTLPYALFGSYLTITCSLIFTVIRSLNQAYHALPPSAAVRSRRTARIHHVEFYAFLALISLFSTIYFNSHILTLSYRVWAWERDPAPLRPLGENLLQLGNIHGWQWGRWLRETDVLAEFYEIAVERTRRRWWMQQLLMAGTPWSVFAVVEGQRRRIPHLWAFIGLAPLVSLSFAQSLFFLALLWTPVPLSQRRILGRAVSPNHPLFLGAIIATFAGVSILPFTTGTVAFRTTILALVFTYFAPLAVPVVQAYLGTEKAPGKPQKGTHQHALFRLSAILALFVHIAHLSAALLDDSDLRAYWNRHSMIYHYQAEPPAWKQAQTRVAKILNAATDHPSVARAATDTVIAAVGLFMWTYFRGLKVKEILSSVALWGDLPEHMAEKLSSETSKALTTATDSARKKTDSISRSGKRKVSQKQSRSAQPEDEEDDDADYVPSGKQPIQAGDDDREESTEAATLSWGLSVVGGLGYLSAGTLGAEATV